MTLSSLKSIELVDSLVNSILSRFRLDDVPPKTALCMMLDQLQYNHPEAFEFLEKKYKEI